MPLYFFNMTDGYRSDDTEGTDLPDIVAARTEAVVFAGSTLRDSPDKVWDGTTMHVEVTDEAGMMLFIVTCFVTDARVAASALPL